MKCVTFISQIAFHVCWAVFICFEQQFVIRPEQWDSILYVHPKKLDEPCARIESDGEWFPIDRVLDSIYIVGTDKMWQHLVGGLYEKIFSRNLFPR